MFSKIGELVFFFGKICLYIFYRCVYICDFYRDVDRLVGVYY